MCRHLAYLGPPVDLGSLLVAPPHSLVRQASAPRDMRGGGTINADGFGVGWYGPDDPAGPPVRYRRALPMWADGAFAALAPTVRSGAVLAAVRSATAGMPVVDTACAPFGTGRWLFSHNGAVLGWPGSLAGLAAGLPVTDLLTLDAPTDSAVLWALVRHRLDRGDPPAAALAGVVRDVLAVSPASRLTLLLTDGATVAATTVHHGLSVRCAPDAVVVASEPLDDAPGWQPVADRRVLAAAPGALSVTPL